MISFIEISKWAVISFAIITLIKKANIMRDAEVLCLIVILVTNLGIWVGGYSFIFYITLIPVLINLRLSCFYLSLVAIIAIPLDIIPLLRDVIPMKYSYLSNSIVDVNWTLGIGSLIRPVLNIILLLTLTYEIIIRKSKIKMMYYCLD
jgi:hypothetical protein